MNILSKPEGVYPLFNDSYVKIESSFPEPLYMEVKLNDSAEEPYVVYSIDDTFIFNLKDLAKQSFNFQGFEDRAEDIDYIIPAFNDGSGYKLITFEAKIVYANSTDNATFFAEFYAGIAQENEAPNSSLKLPRELTYWEGFPFDFGVRKVLQETPIVISNINTGNETSDIEASSTGSYRIFIDKGDNHNWTSTNELPLKEGLNELEVWFNNGHQFNLDLHKRKDKEGIYLKWWNKDGYYSYHLFETFSESFEGRSTQRIPTNNFNNIGDLSSKERELRRQAASSINVSTYAHRHEVENLKFILESPYVVMYSSRTPNEKGFYIDVDVQGSVEIPNKRDRNTVELTINLPEKNIIKY